MLGIVEIWGAKRIELASNLLRSPIQGAGYYLFKCCMGWEQVFTERTISSHSLLHDGSSPLEFPPKEGSTFRLNMSALERSAK